MRSKVIPVEPFDLVLFGATGDLSRREIIPSLYRRFAGKQVLPGSKIIGASRSGNTDSFLEFARASISKRCKDPDPGTIDDFLKLLSFVPLDARLDAGWPELRQAIRSDRIQAYYLSVSPSLFGPIAERIGGCGAANRSSRIVLEKPFGYDLESARSLNASLLKTFSESQIYRTDHYLAKETVQNLMAIRFANAFFEPIWNNKYVENVQITVAESIGVKGRGEYYDSVGAMRDMVQNHLMQLLCLVAMEPPWVYEPDAVRDEKLKVIKSLEIVRPEYIVRGQYLADGDRGSYREDAGNPDSKTESFVALRCNIANWRWAGTPFYLRTGKRLRARVSEVAIVFKKLPHLIFGKGKKIYNNVLVLRLQPDEGITMNVMIKEPGLGGMRLEQVPLDMSFSDALGSDGLSASAYERLILDVIRGNQTLFMRGDEVEAAWAWADPIISQWEENGETPESYSQNSEGPRESVDIFYGETPKWRPIE
ncbi:MAG: glucose-6-phosphate dehydrogenase [Albidovulum sp.]|nr:glucose-6-phosphate dehydrogenase [Albidovulum sp.]MDE0305307.1 glucose-6-phosphate dehydrogenase [Albidovulum sp.]MDE0530989.1 glucose-6-phosphate dehydrogenase [Albidovulum sp.]